MGDIRIGSKTAGVPEAVKHITVVERDAAFLREQLWPETTEALQRALVEAEDREDLPSAEIASRIARLEEHLARTREDLAESQALLDAAQRERAEVEDLKERYRAGRVRSYDAPGG